MISENTLKGYGTFLDQPIDLKLIELNDNSNTGESVPTLRDLSNRPILFYEGKNLKHLTSNIDSEYENDHSMTYLRRQNSRKPGYVGYQWKFDEELEVCELEIDLIYSLFTNESEVSVHISDSVDIELKSNSDSSFEENLKKAKKVDLSDFVKRIIHFENTISLRDYLGGSSNLTLIFMIHVDNGHPREAQLFRKYQDQNYKNHPVQSFPTPPENVEQTHHFKLRAISNEDRYKDTCTFRLGLSPKILVGQDLRNIIMIKNPSSLILNRYDFDYTKWSFPRLVQFLHETRDINYIHTFIGGYFPSNSSFKYVDRIIQYANSSKELVERFNNNKKLYEEISEVLSLSFSYTDPVNSYQILIHDPVTSMIQTISTDIKLLMRYSDYFKSLESSSMKESQIHQSSFQSDDVVNFETMEMVMKFLVLPLIEKIRLLQSQSIEKLVQLLKISDRLLIPLLSDLTERVIINSKITSLNIDKVFDLLKQSQISQTNLMQFCYWYTECRKLLLK